MAVLGRDLSALEHRQWATIPILAVVAVVVAVVHVRLLAHLNGILQCSSLGEYRYCASDYEGEAKTDLLVKEVN